MKTVHYTPDAARNLLRFRTMADRIRRTLAGYAADGHHANNVTKLVGSTASRLRVGDFRVIFEETDTTITVTKIGPRSSIYE